MWECSVLLGWHCESAYLVLQCSIMQCSARHCESVVYCSPGIVRVEGSAVPGIVRVQCIACPALWECSAVQSWALWECISCIAVQYSAVQGRALWECSVLLAQHCESAVQWLALWEWRAVMAGSGLSMTGCQPAEDFPLIATFPPSFVALKHPHSTPTLVFSHQILL